MPTVAIPLVFLFFWIFSLVFIKFHAKRKNKKNKVVTMEKFNEFSFPLFDENENQKLKQIKRNRL